MRALLKKQQAHGAGSTCLTDHVHVMEMAVAQWTMLDQTRRAWSSSQGIKIGKGGHVSLFKAVAFECKGSTISKI